MYKKYINFLTLTVLLIPSSFFAMHKPLPRLQESSFDEVRQTIAMPQEQLQELMAAEQEDILALLGGDTPEARQALSRVMEVLQTLKGVEPHELDSRLDTLLQKHADSMRNETQRIDNQVREHALLKPWQKVQAYWHDLHPVVKAGVISAATVATSYMLKKFRIL